MRWEAVEIAKFARGAGFHGDDVTTATAVALATSGGVASFDVSAHAPGCGHWVGLWGVNVDKYPELADRDLHVPYVAAAVAHELCERHGGWEWAPAFTSGQYVPFLAHAGTEQSREYDHQRPVLPFTFHHTDKALRARQQRLATRAAAATQVHNLRRG